MRLCLFGSLVCIAAAACSGGGSGDAVIGPPAPAQTTPGAPTATSTPSSSTPTPSTPTATGFHVLAQYTDALHGILYANGFVYAVHSSTDALEIFDASTLAPVKTLAVGHVPGRLAASGTDVLVANELARDIGDAYLSVVDTHTNTVTRSLGVSEKNEGPDPDNHPFTNFPFDLAVGGGKVFVAFPSNALGLNMMSIDQASWTEKPFFPAGSGPGAMAVVGSRLVVTLGRAIANPNDDGIVVLDGASVVHTFETGGRLHDAVSAGGKAWIAHADASGASSSSATTPGWIDVIDPNTLTASKVDVGAGPYGLALAGDLLYVMCQYAMRVDVVDTKTSAVIRSIDLSNTTPAIVNPRGLAASPRGDVFVESDGMISALVVP